MNIYLLIQNICNSQGGWSKQLTASFLLVSILQATVPIKVLGQQDTTKKVDFFNQASYTYNYIDSDNLKSRTIEGSSSTLQVSLVDPLGKILGCDGNLLPDYNGFTVALYEPAGNSSIELGVLTDLTRTDDIAGNDIPKGIEPNSENKNPFSVPNIPEKFKGSYNFLFDKSKGQINPGKTYLMVINPPANSIYQQRRIQLRIEQSTGTEVRYTASSLDGLPISLDGQNQIEATQVLVANADKQGLILSALQLSTDLCQTNQVGITKTGDRASAAPGDTVIYRLSVKNNSNISIKNVSITDLLPLGFRFLPNSVRAESKGQTVVMNTTPSGSTINFKADLTMAVGQVLNIAYAAQLTNDAQRGTGKNIASVEGQRDDRTNLIVRDGPVSYTLKIVPGIVTDAGTIIGRVFVDKNFDGEQQNDEPGVPNAVIYLQNGNRITTDPNGLFSISNVLPGYYTGVLDLTSLPGYTLAPNRKFNERNSQSRLVHLEPGGLVRMNFAVTPSFKEQVEK